MAGFEDKLLLAYNEKYVVLNKTEMEENTNIARSFVRGFVKWVQEDYHLQLKLVEQGSSFEGLKVDKPDEYDFLFVIEPSNLSHHYIPLRGHSLREDVTDMKRTSGLLNSYNPVLMSGTEKRVLDCAIETWPRMEEEHKVLSARLSLRFFQFLLITYGNYLRRASHSNRNAEVLSGIKKIDPPVVENPALKTVLHKHDGSTICIDTSPAVRLRCPDTERLKLCIAKRKPVLRGVNDERLRLLWLNCFSEREKKVISEKKDNEKRNFCIVKRAFRDIIGISYIWKTLFMSQDEPFPESPYDFMMTMVRQLKTSLDAELHQREEDYGHCSIAGSHPLNNQAENILDRYDDEQLEDWNDQLNDIIGFDEQGNTRGLFAQLLGPSSLTQLIQYVRYRR